MSLFAFSCRVLAGLNIALFLAVATCTEAQVIPDSTLGSESSTLSPNQVIKNVLSDRVDGGARRGANLFHSFQEFNINEGRAVYFSNPDGVANILSRVTGVNPSILLGKLGVLGNANLFFLNPNGIIFGSNASLDVTGSFLATTANSIHFADGTIFSAKNAQPALLTISVPVGLGFTESAGTIQVQGSGHNLIALGDPRIPNIPFGGSVPTGLAVQPGKTLALLGGDINFSGGVITAPSGRIEIGSVASAQVKITFTAPDNFFLNYEEVSNFQDIALTQQSLLNASGVSNGNIQIVGRNISLTDASLVFIENQGANPLGAIQVNASNVLTLTGTTASTPIFRNNIRLTRGLVSQALDKGKGADINISANQLVVQDSGRIYLSTFGSGLGGNLNIKAFDSVKILGISPFDLSFPLSSLISTASVGSGEAGSIAVTTQYLSLQEGGILSSAVFGDGIGGDLRIEAFDSIVLTGFNLNSFFPSLISSATNGAGAGGNLSINTRQLTLQNGGRVDTSTLASGDAGSLTINATDFIEVSGTIPGSINPSLIISAANRVDPVIQKGFGLPEIPTGAAGNVTINTQHLSVLDGALISVKNDGVGDAGTLKVQTDSLVLDHSGGITASTILGNGGNIDLAAKQVQLRHNSAITSTAGGTGNGGSIFIDTDTLVALENSDITANAFAGQGGAIQINAQGAFFSPNSEITASSELGIDGSVEINTPDVQLQNSLEQLNARVTNPTQVLAGSCLERRQHKQKGSFTYAGVEGLPETPSQPSISIGKPLSEIQPLSEPSETPNQEKVIPHSSEFDQGLASPFSYHWKLGMPIVEGSQLIKTSDGKLLWVASAEQMAAIEQPENPSSCR